MTKVTIPTNSKELEDFLGDKDKMQGVVNDAAQLRELVTNYARNVMAKDGAIATQVREETQKALGEMAKENGVQNKLNLDPFTSPSNAKNSLYNKKAPGAQLDNKFTNSAEFFQSIWHHADSLQNGAELTAKRNDLRKIQNAFGSTIPADGGFLIPEVLRSELLQVALETSITRPLARVIPMESLRVPVPAIDSTSNVSSVFGGVVCYWTEEGATLTETSASFSRVVLDAKKLTGYAEMPNELIADATAFGSFFNQIFPQAMAFYEDDAFINGSGAGEPEGWLNGGASVSVTKETNQPADTIVWENIVKMYARMLPTSLKTAVWIVAPNTFAELATMALSVGTGGSAIWLNNGAAGPPMTILGRPVIVSEKVPALGNAGDVNFVDLGYYLIGDRQVMQVQSSPHYKFANDKTAFRVIERVDGRPWLQSAITPKNNGDTLSPFVKLGERA